ncbi:MAG: hypothetical protein JXA87_09975 [Thermoleophilia bacterium]|nr:hypothetical protein [Thermoleophilia bacterium]
MFEEAYNQRPHDRQPFGEHWVHDGGFPHGVETLVARYERTSGDGQTTEVFVTAMPARFYTIKVRESETTEGRALPAWALSTGSGRHDLAARIAEAIAAGMLGVAD